MNQNNQNLDSSSNVRNHERQQMIETLKAPIIQIGKNIGVKVIENYDQGAGPIDVLWTFKLGSEALPDIRMGFVCLISEYSESQVNEIIIKSMMNLVDKLVIVVPSENITKRISDSIESMPNSSFLQLRKYVTVLTPSTLVPKPDFFNSREREEVIE
ncbi:MAG: hypothetical protein ACRD8K_04175 [Nitrososphaeraceae archaeon]